MTPEELQSEREFVEHCIRTGTGYTWPHRMRALFRHIDEQDETIRELRRGQGRAPTSTTPGPVPVPLHEAHPIPDSTKEGA